jgi:hypothetical protein
LFGAPQRRRAPSDSHPTFEGALAARASLVAPVVSPHFISTVIRASGGVNSQAGLMPLPSAQAQALQWRKELRALRARFYMFARR